MSRPLQRGISGEQRRLSVGSHGSWDFQDSQMKEKSEKDDTRASRSLSDQGYSSLKLPFHLNSLDNGHSKLGVNENGFTTDLFSSKSPRNRHKFILLMLRISLVFIVILALTGSFWWTISISTSSRGHIFHSYRRLQEQLVSDLTAISELSLGPAKLRELDFCSKEYENLCLAIIFLKALL